MIVQRSQEGRSGHPLLDIHLSLVKSLCIHGALCGVPIKCSVTFCRKFETCGSLNAIVGVLGSGCVLCLLLKLGFTRYVGCLQPFTQSGVEPGCVAHVAVLFIHLLQ